MSNSILKLQVLVRAELAISQIRARRAAVRSAFFFVAMIFGLVGLGLMNLACYQYLIAPLGPALAALVMALVNGAVAGIVLLMAGRAGPNDNEEKLAKEMRDLAYAELSKDIERLNGELARISTDVGRIRTGVSSVAGGAASIGPLVGALVKTVKSRSE
jgi:hypothetical protein